MTSPTLRRATAAVIGVVTVILLSAASCDSTTPQAQQEGQKQTEEAFRQQSATVPYPASELKDSLERRNLRERLRRTNDPNKIGYLYLLPAMGGMPYAYYVIKGKVSSTQSQMTTEQFAVYAQYGNFTIPAPGDDGSYGMNEGGQDGIFFFTVEGTFVETNVRWQYSDRPLPINVPKFNN